MIMKLKRSLMLRHALSGFCPVFPGCFGISESAWCDRHERADRRPGWSGGPGRPDAEPQVERGPRAVMAGWRATSSDVTLDGADIWSAA